MFYKKSNLYTKSRIFFFHFLLFGGNIHFIEVLFLHLGSGCCGINP